MAYYAYKQVRDIIPRDWKESYIKKSVDDGRYDTLEQAEVSFCEGDYDGGMWVMAADYIKYLHDKLKENK